MISMELLTTIISLAVGVVTIVGANAVTLRRFRTEFKSDIAGLRSDMVEQRTDLKAEIPDTTPN